MIDLRGMASDTPQICRYIPPVVDYVEVEDSSGKVSRRTELRPVLCYRDACAHFCKEHRLCVDMCEHMITHGMFVEGCDEDCEGYCG